MKNHWFFICLLLFFVCLAACQKDEPVQPPPQLVEELAVSQTAVAGLMAEAQGNEAELMAAQATAESAMAALANVEATAVAAQSEVEIQANRAFAHQIAALSLTKLDTDLPTAVLLAVQASKMADTPTTRSALLYALQYNPRLQTILPTGYLPADVDFSADGRFLAVVMPSGKVTLYDLATNFRVGENLSGLSELDAGEGGSFPVVAFSPDSKFIVATNPVGFESENENKIVVWDVETRQIVATSDHSIIGLTFLQNDFLVTYGVETGSLWEIDEGHLIEKSSFDMPEDYGPAGVSSVAAHPDGETIAFGHPDGLIRLWSPFTNQVVDLSDFKPSGGIRALAYSPNGDFLAISASGQVTLWDTIQNQLFGEPIPSTAQALEFSQDGQTLMTADRSEIIRLWNVADQKIIDEPLQRWGNTEVLLDAALHPKGNLVASSYEARSAIIWDRTATTRLGQTLITFPNEQVAGNFSSEAFLNTNTLVTGGGYGALAFIDITSGDILSTTKGYPDPNLREIIYNNDYTIAATRVYTNEVNTITVWDVFKNQPIGQPIILPDFTSSLALNPDGTLLAIGSGEGLLRFWDVTSETFIGEPIADHERDVIALAFSPDGSVLASSGFNEIHLRDSETGELLFPPISGTADRLIFHPQNKTVIAIRDMGGLRVHVWDIVTGEYKGEVPQGYEIIDIAFSPDGQYRASAQRVYINFGKRGFATTLWDVETKLPVGLNLEGYWAPVFNEDGSILATTYLQNGAPTEIVLWDMGLERWQEVACQLVNENFTEEAWGLYFGERPYEQTCPTMP